MNFFRAPIRLPENVVVDVVIVTKKEGVLTHRVIAEELTSTYKDIGMRCERDAFDTLFDHAPDKLQVGNLFFNNLYKSKEIFMLRFHLLALMILIFNNLYYINA